MSDSSVTVTDQTTGVEIDCEELTVGAQAVKRQRVQLAGASAAEIAAVLRGPPDADAYALAVRSVFPPSMRTAFGALLAQEERCVAALNFSYFVDPKLVVTSECANGGTVDSNAGKARLQTGTASNGLAVLESRDIIRYVAGQSVRAVFSTHFDTPRASSRQIIGIGAAQQDGFFFGYNGTEFGICKRAAGVETWIYRADWIDPLDGTGASGVNLNPQYLNVYTLPYQWLGAGPAYFRVEHPATGEQIPVYDMQHANLGTATSVRNPSFALRAEVQNLGSTSNLTLQTPSMAAFVAGPEFRGGPRRPGFASKGGVTSEVPLVTLRNMATFKAIPNRARAVLDFLAVASATNNQDARFCFVLNPATLTGATYAAFVDADSMIEIDTAASAFTGGTRLHYMPVDATLTSPMLVRDLGIFLRPGDVMCITAQAGGSCTVAADFGLVEER